MLTSTDQLGNIVQLTGFPRRIISLVPSQTELLFSLGLTSQVIGITKFCIHPAEWFKEKNKVGGTKNVNVERIQKLKPDLVIANKEENTKKDIEAINGFCKTWVSDVSNLTSALSMILQIGTMVDRATAAKKND